MKKILFAFVAMFALAACGNKQATVSAESDEASNEVAFEVAKNYFFKNDQEIPASPKIKTAEDFGKLFGRRNLRTCRNLLIIFEEVVLGHLKGHLITCFVALSRSDCLFVSTCCQCVNSN